MDAPSAPQSIAKSAGRRTSNPARCDREDLDSQRCLMAAGPPQMQFPVGANVRATGNHRPITANQALSDYLPLPPASVLDCVGLSDFGGLVSSAPQPRKVVTTIDRSMNKHTFFIADLHLVRISNVSMARTILALSEQSDETATGQAPRHGTNHQHRMQAVQPPGGGHSVENELAKSINAL
jgi:hypothetical protein